MKILLLGAQGQLGQAFQEIAKTDAFPIGWILISWNREKGDLSNPEQLIKHIADLSPDVILNAAALTNVDLAETDKEKSTIINVTAPRALAEYGNRHGATFVHFSTDYVYAGEGENEHSESDPMRPQNHYGLTKSAGDQAIIDSGCDYLIFRTSWVYSHTGKNFVKTMLKLAAEKPELKVVQDQVGSPTYAPDLAQYALEAMMRALEAEAQGKPFPSGVYHVANAGFTSWYEFARAILPKTKIKAISSQDFPTPAKRPLNSRLSLEKFKKTFAISPRPWREALHDCLIRIENDQHV